MSFKEDELAEGDPEVIFELLKELCWMGTFYYDNKIFCARTKIIRFDEGYNFTRFSRFWTAADLFSIIGCLFTLKRLAKLKKGLIEGEVSGRFNGTQVTEVSERLQAINKQVAWAQYRLIKTVMNILVSGEFAGLWKYLFSRGLGRGTQGLFGVITGIMGIYEEWSLLQDPKGDTRSIDNDLRTVFSYKKSD